MNTPNNIPQWAIGTAPDSRFKFARELTALILSALQEQREELEGAKVRNSDITEGYSK